MDHTRIKTLRKTLTFHFAIIAWLTAMLVATGSGSYFLPVFILVFSVGALIFVDTLEWFELGQIGSYIGMSIATLVAVGSWVVNLWGDQSEGGQLTAVAGLLVYPEAVLFLQRKSLRVFEQLAVFLLLEMIVAALINDNILFGILLSPIMLLWVSSLFLFSRYATLTTMDPSIEKPIPVFAEVLYKSFMKSVSRSNNKEKRVTAVAIPSVGVQSSSIVRRALQTVPIGIGALSFAALFFYFLPRTSPGTIQPALGRTAKVGIPDSLNVSFIGRILQDSTPVMRVSFSDYGSSKHYELRSPPYLRASVFDKYNTPNSFFRTKSEWVASGVTQFSAVPKYDRRKFMIDNGTDSVVARFDIKKDSASRLFTLPLSFATTKSQSISLRYDRLNLTLQPLDQSSSQFGRPLDYEIGTVGFSKGEQVRVLPSLLDARIFFGGPDDIRLRSLPKPFSRLRAYWTKVLEQRKVSPEDLFRASQTIEDHFVASGEFGYSLDLSPPSDPTLDPIEDFVINQKRGHCQFYSSAMAVILRQMGIQSRIVIGYHPTEFNEVGKYFAVKQSDAHAWVEALFTRAELENTPLAKWLTDADTYWVRFDPTPSGNGRDMSIKTQRGQTIDYAEKLWKDFVVDGQRLSQGDGIYSPMTENSKDAYAKMIERFRVLRTQLMNGDFSFFTEFRFAWPLAIVVMFIGVAIIFAWRTLGTLPKWAPGLAKFFGYGPKAEQQIRQPFFAKCLQMLEQNGTRRKNSQTPQEFTEQAASELVDSSTNSLELNSALKLLTELYYKLRYRADSDITSEDAVAIEKSLQLVEQATRNNSKG